jgi:hypothetical protein
MIPPLPLSVTNEVLLALVAINRAETLPAQLAEIDRLTHLLYVTRARLSYKRELSNPFEEDDGLDDTL